MRQGHHPVARPGGCNRRVTAADLGEGGGFEACVSHEFGDQDEAVAFADEADAEGVA